MRAAGPILHATLIARLVHGRWQGALIRGRSGSGKSDLALRAVATGWRLVADDRVVAWSSAGRLYGAAPAPLTGLIEARGLDVVPCHALPFARIRLVVDAPGQGVAPERLPAKACEALAGVSLPRLELVLLEPSAVLKLALALDAAAREVV